MKVTVGGTVAAAGVLELRLMVTPPAGAAADKVRVKFCVVNPEIVRLGGVKLTVAVTSTAALAEVYPVAVAVMFADPRLTPVIVGCDDGVVCPAAMLTVGVEIVTLPVSVLASAMVTAVGAGAARLIANVADLPKPTVVLLGGRLIVAGLRTVTLMVAFAMPGATAVAVMVVAPCPTAVTSTLTVAAFAGKLTLAGTVAAFVLLELRFTVRPPEGAGAERFSATFCVAIPLIVTAGDAKLIVAVTCTGALAAL